ncbi:arsenate reductase [Ectothiorhodospira haloalkaliphila]|nr:arsenate reductase [Ectothiorhodospira haloalkaliphila]
MPHLEQDSVCRLYGIKNCDTMKKAIAWLNDHGIEYTFIDYKKTGVVASRLPHWNQAVGWAALINRRGLTWRKLPQEARDPLDESRARDLMETHPTLIRRPVLERGTEVLVGFDADQYKAVLA